MSSCDASGSACSATVRRMSTPLRKFCAGDGERAGARDGDGRGRGGERVVYAQVWTSARRRASRVPRENGREDARGAILIQKKACPALRRRQRTRRCLRETRSTGRPVKRVPTRRSSVAVAEWGAAQSPMPAESVAAQASAFQARNSCRISGLAPSGKPFALPGRYAFGTCACLVCGDACCLRASTPLDPPGADDERVPTAQDCGQGCRPLGTRHEAPLPDERHPLRQVRARRG